VQDDLLLLLRDHAADLLPRRDRHTLDLVLLAEDTHCPLYRLDVHILVQPRPSRLQHLSADIHLFLGPYQPVLAALGLDRPGLARQGPARRRLAWLDRAWLHLTRRSQGVRRAALLRDGEAEVAPQLIGLRRRHVLVRADLGAAHDLLRIERDAEPVFGDLASGKRDEPKTRPGPDPGPDRPAIGIVVEYLLDRAHYLAIAARHPGADELICLHSHGDASPRKVNHSR
jgi:hypothetical protein